MGNGNLLSPMSHSVFIQIPFGGSTNAGDEQKTFLSSWPLCWRCVKSPKISSAGWKPSDDKEYQALVEINHSSDFLDQIIGDPYILKPEPVEPPR
jgi:hypothetical protein